MGFLDPFGGGGNSTATDNRQAAADQGKNVHGNSNILLEPGSANTNLSGNKGVLGNGYQLTNVKGNVTINAAAPDNSGLLQGLANTLTSFQPPAFPASAVPTATSTTPPADNATPDAAAGGGLSLWWIILPVLGLLGLLLIVFRK